MNLSSRSLPVALLVALAIGGCAGPSTIEPPRSIIIFSGARIQADMDRMNTTDLWFRELNDYLERNRGLVRVLAVEERVYPWETLEAVGDSLIVARDGNALDVEGPFRAYGFLRLAEERNLLVDWLPDAEGMSGFDLELEILARTADVWLLGRSVYDTAPYEPLDELIYAREGGFLREFALVTQEERFPDEHAAHFEANPERADAFRAWFEDTFERSGPGFIGNRGALDNIIDGMDPDGPGDASEGEGR